MFKFITHIILLLFIFSVTNCNDNPTNVEPLQYNVALSFVIVTDSVRQKALLSYVKPVNSNYSNYAALIDSANFHVNNIRMLYNLHPEFEFYHNRERYYNYYSDSLNLKAEDTVKLTIIKNNITITGQTIIPGNFTISTNGKTISWTKSKNAFYYFIKVENEKRTFTWQTTTMKLNVTINDKRFIPDNYKIEICAFDKNYYNYYNNGINNAGIEGAYGIFGAVNRVKINTRLQ